MELIFKIKPQPQSQSDVWKIHNHVVNKVVPMMKSDLLEFYIPSHEYQGVTRYARTLNVVLSLELNNYKEHSVRKLQKWDAVDDTFKLRLDDWTSTNFSSEELSDTQENTANNDK